MNILGVDIGGTAVKLGLLDEQGHVMAKEAHSVCFDGYRTPILTTALARARALIQRTGTQIDGIGGEIGHMPLRSGGRPCTCGNSGCYEQYASVTALLSRAEKVLGARPDDAKALFDRAALGDAATLALLDAWTGDIAAGLVGLTHLFNPELILLGGGVSRQEALLIQPVRQRVLSRAMPRFADALRIEAATLGNDAGMIGAARCWLDEQSA